MATSTVREVIVGRQRKKRPLCLCVSGSGEMAPVVCYPKSHLLHWPSQITEASVINLVTRPINFSFHQHGPRTFWHTQTCACVHRCTLVMHICVCITHNCVSLFFFPPSLMPIYTLLLPLSQLTPLPPSVPEVSELWWARRCPARLVDSLREAPRWLTVSLGCSQCQLKVSVFIHGAVKLRSSVMNTSALLVFYLCRCQRL